MTNRKPFIAGNWKLNKNIAETKSFCSELQTKITNDDAVEVAVIPPFTSLQAAKENISSIKLGAQDLAQFESGAYTGEISAEMLLEIGVEYVLVGHSERREIFNEDNSVIRAKLERALAAGLKVVLCCGESLETREAGKTDEWVSAQLDSALSGLSLENAAEKLVIAYEPIWAIGTGKTCDADEANRTIAAARATVAKILGEDAAAAIRILYGGSVKPASIEEQMSKSDIDGALVGGASLQVEDFSAIVAGAAAKAAC